MRLKETSKVSCAEPALLSFRTTARSQRGLADSGAGFYDAANPPCRAGAGFLGLQASPLFPENFIDAQGTLDRRGPRGERPRSRNDGWLRWRRQGAGERGHERDAGCRDARRGYGDHAGGWRRR